MVPWELVRRVHGYGEASSPSSGGAQPPPGSRRPLLSPEGPGKPVIHLSAQAGSGQAAPQNWLFQPPHITGLAQGRGPLGVQRLRLGVGVGCRGEDKAVLLDVWALKRTRK